MNRLSKNEEKMRDMFNSKEFEYDPSHWQEAEKLLKQRKSSRFKAIWLTFPVLVAFAGIIRFASPAPENSLSYKQKETSMQTEKAKPIQPNHSEGKSSSSINNGTTTNNISSSTTVPLAMPQATTHTYNDNVTGVQTHTSTTDKKANEGSKLPSQPEKENTESSPIDKTKKQKTTLPTTDNDEKKSLPEEENNITTPNTAPPLVAEDNDDTEETEKEKSGKKEKKQANNKRPVLVKHSIAALAGANYSKLLQANGNSYINTPHASIQYQYQPSTKWKFAAGIGYTYVSANDFEKQYAVEEHGFGVTKYQTSISTDKLHYLETPILVKYNAIGRFSLTAGTNITYLLNTNNTVTESRYNTLEGSHVVQQRKETLYTRGINKWDIQAQLGIEYKLNNNLHIGLLANSGLLDVSKNTYYNSAVFNRNSRLQLYFKYDFFRF